MNRVIFIGLVVLVLGCKKSEDSAPKCTWFPIYNGHTASYKIHHFSINGSSPYDEERVSTETDSSFNISGFGVTLSDCSTIYLDNSGIRTPLLIKSEIGDTVYTGSNSFIIQDDRQVDSLYKATLYTNNIRSLSVILQPNKGIALITRYYSGTGSISEQYTLIQ